MQRSVRLVSTIQALVESFATTQDDSLLHGIGFGFTSENPVRPESTDYSFVGAALGSGRDQQSPLILTGTRRRIYSAHQRVVHDNMRVLWLGFASSDLLIRAFLAVRFGGEAIAGDRLTFRRWTSALPEMQRNRRSPESPKRSTLGKAHP